VIKNKVIDPFSCKEYTVTGASFLAMMENIALHHVSLGTTFQLDHHPTSLIAFVLCWTASFLMVG